MLIRCPCTVQAFAWTDGQPSPGFDRFASSIAKLDIELSPKEAYACRRPEDPSTCRKGDQRLSRRITHKRPPKVKLTDLRGILQYIPRFRDKVFVISLDGAVVEGENIGNLLLDIALLRSLNIQPVILHGAALQIARSASEKGFQPSDTCGHGITDADTLQVAIQASHRVTHTLLQGLSGADLKAAVTNAIVAHPKGILKGVDHLFTGKVERVDHGLLETLIKEGIVPIIQPLGYDGEGRTFRVNSDAVALAVAKALKAAKLIFITAQDGLMFDGELIREMAVNNLDERLRQQRDLFDEESLSKALHAAEACRWHVPRAHIINGSIDEGLLAEVFSNEGIGTLIYANEYQQIRPAKKKDVATLFAMTRASVAKEELLRRTRASIEKHISDYYIFETDHHPIGCVALHRYEDHKSGELAFLYVNPSHENEGIGKKLIQFVEEKATKLQLEQLFLLSTQAYAYFQSQGGYLEGTVEHLPESRRALYEQSGRKSKILYKPLG